MKFILATIAAAFLLASFATAVLTNDAKADGGIVLRNVAKAEGDVACHGNVAELHDAPANSTLRSLTEDRSLECLATIDMLEVTLDKECTNFDVIGSAEDPTQEEKLNEYCNGRCHAYHVYVLKELGKYCDIAGDGTSKVANRYQIQSFQGICSRNRATGRLCIAEFGDATGSFIPQNNDANLEFLCSSPCGADFLYPHYKVSEALENVETGSAEPALDAFKICAEHRLTTTVSAAKHVPTTSKGPSSVCMASGGCGLQDNEANRESVNYGTCSSDVPFGFNVAAIRSNFHTCLNLCMTKVSETPLKPAVATTASPTMSGFAVPKSMNVWYSARVLYDTLVKAVQALFAKS